jgi:cation transport ATPase
MIPFGVLVPLLVSGMTGAAVRHYKQRRDYADKIDLPAITDQRQTKKNISQSIARVFDDVGELHHYQRTAWYSLALSAAGYWFFTPVALLSLPLLGYNGYHYYRTLRHSDPAEKKTPVAVFEGIGVTACLLTGRTVTAAILFLLSFGTRKLLLQAGNISHNVGLKNAINPSVANIWVLRNDAEIEISIAELEPNDIVILHAGDTVTVPGKVIKGHGSMHQFSLQKQMKRVPKQPGDQVYPFTKVHSGYLHIQPS